MKVILLQDVKTVGKKGAVITVSDGYAMNFLFPRKLAVKASEHSLEVQQQQIDQKKQELANQKAEAEAMKLQLEAMQIRFSAKSGKDGKMFGSISTKQIAEEIKNKYQVVIDKRKFVNPAPITVLGVTKMQIELFKGVIATISVNVVEQ